MQKISKILRSNYVGEDVIVDRVYKNSKWNPTTEFVSKSFSSGPLSNHALVIGNGTSRLQFNLKKILEHRVGNFDSWAPAKQARKFFTYGCNALFREYRTDFLIATGDNIIKEIAESGICDRQVVYANNTSLVEYPGKFHLIPQNLPFNSGALAAYMAAFDGHKKVFLMGFDGNDTPNYNYNVYAGTTNYPELRTTVLEDYWILSLLSVMTAYNDVEFVRVAPTSSFRTPEPWKYCLNFRTIDFRQFASEADV